MSDMVMIAIVICFFTLCAFYVKACGRI